MPSPLTPRGANARKRSGKGDGEPGDEEARERDSLILEAGLGGRAATRRRRGLRRARVGGRHRRLGGRRRGRLRGSRRRLDDQRGALGAELGLGRVLVPLAADGRDLPDLDDVRVALGFPLLQLARLGVAPHGVRGDSVAVVGRRVDHRARRLDVLEQERVGSLNDHAHDGAGLDRVRPRLGGTGRDVDSANGDIVDVLDALEGPGSRVGVHGVNRVRPVGVDRERGLAQLPVRHHERRLDRGGVATLVVVPEHQLVPIRHPAIPLERGEAGLEVGEADVDVPLPLLVLLVRRPGAQAGGADDRPGALRLGLSRGDGVGAVVDHGDSTRLLQGDVRDHGSRHGVAVVGVNEHQLAVHDGPAVTGLGRVARCDRANGLESRHGRVGTDRPTRRAGRLRRVDVEVDGIRRPALCRRSWRKRDVGSRGAFLRRDGRGGPDGVATSAQHLDCEVAGDRDGHGTRVGPGSIGGQVQVDPAEFGRAAEDADDAGSPRGRAADERSVDLVAGVSDVHASDGSRRAGHGDGTGGRRNGDRGGARREAERHDRNQQRHEGADNSEALALRGQTGHDVPFPPDVPG